MKQTCLNPYLPSWEYIPDGEPYVFGDRVYVYGSHDRFNGYAYCLNDYVCWSAPIDDLSDWKYEGVIFKKTDDPINPDGEMCLYAPDVTQGPDGRYYLYYVYDALPIVSVAVCDTPAGKYEFYGYVKYKDGTLLGEGENDQPQFDPGLLTEGDTTYLYTGFCMPNDGSRSGSMVTVLGKDMLTIEQAPKYIIPNKPNSAGTGFEGHEFFEASSIRKVDNTYYFIYSSILSHELCYATSESPLGPFTYRGTIVSNNDMFIDSYKPARQAMAYGGNNHGSIIQIKEDWYVFYHRHTNAHNYSRQGCIEKIQILPDGSIPQVEMTSHGAYNEPFSEKGEYPAYIACNLYCSDYAENVGAPSDFMDSRFPRITQEGKDGDQIPAYIDNMRSGATAGFKYFDFNNVTKLKIKARGWGQGCFIVKTSWNGPELGRIPVYKTNEWKEYEAEISLPDGKHALYFEFNGEGSIFSLSSFTLL